MSTSVQEASHELRFTSRRMLRVVLYHDIADAESLLTRGLGVCTPSRVFAQHLEYYERHYTVVGLDEVLTGRLPSRALVITFDDCYRSLITTAAPMLAQRGLPSVAFVNTRCIANPRMMLDNLVCALVHQHGANDVAKSIDANCPGAGSVAEVLTVVANQPWSRRTELEASLLERFAVDEAHMHEAHELYLREADLAELRNMGMEIGCHTASHVHCRCLDAAGAQGEIVDAWRQIEEWIKTRVRAFSYPYGSPVDVTPVTTGALRSVECEAAFLVGGRINTIGSSTNLMLHRISPRAVDVRCLRWELEIKPRIRECRSKLHV